MKAAFLVFIGGGLGSLGRWGMGLLWAHVVIPRFPYATLSVNLIGGVLMGLCAAFLPHMPAIDAGNARLFFMTGILGGFTTFSAFSLDVIELGQRGEVVLACIYVSVSLIGALLAVIFGLWLGGLWHAK